MLKVVSGESSCLEGSEYVRQRGIEVFKAELWAAEVDPRFDICCVVNELLRIKVKYSSERSETGRTGTLI